MSNSDMRKYTFLMTKKVAIAGAAGFVGLALIDSLLSNEDIEVFALSRKERKSSHPRLHWKKADLFSMLDIEKAIRECELVYYLVHSMGPSAHLDQGTFNDYDLILADNFGRACRKLKIDHLIYLGGLIPKDGTLSLHPESRLEVEQAFKNYISNVIVLRAGIIIGYQGSSFNIMIALLKKAPFLLLPPWTSNYTSPIDIRDVIVALTSFAEEKSFASKNFDLMGDKPLTYRSLFTLGLKAMNRKVPLFSFGFNLLFLTKRFIKMITGASSRLVYPLIDSLEHSMIAIDPLDLKASPIKLSDSLRYHYEAIKIHPYRFSLTRPKRKTVRSVQRIIVPEDSNATQIGKEYMYWLPKALYPFLRVFVRDEKVYFCFLSKKIILLRLKHSLERSSHNRQIFYINGGLLAAEQERGRLEFRTVLDKGVCLCAIHDFYPALPWYIYKYTQAKVHLLVMYLFKRHLRLINSGERSWIATF